MTCPPAENAAAPSKMAVDVGEVAIDLRGETVHITITINITIDAPGSQTRPGRGLPPGPSLPQMVEVRVHPCSETIIPSALSIRSLQPAGTTWRIR